MIPGPIRSVLLLTFMVGVTADGLWAASNRVAVRAEASKDYILLRERNESAKRQTYHLIKGKYFGGNVSDSSLDESAFEAITTDLGANLQRQGYFPEKDPAAGDLLIMVHYGASNIFADEDDSDVFDMNDYLPPVEKPNGEVYEYELSRKAIPKFWGDVLPSDRARVKEEYFRSKLLGMDDIFSSKVTDYEAHVQRELAREGRYFIICTAFDLPRLRHGEKKVLWTTRYSIRTIGQSFDQAIKELNFVAGHYFGKNMKGLISKRADDDSFVEMGDIEVVDEEAPDSVN